MKILFINSCMREASRTERLARTFLNAYCQAHPEDTLEELILRKEPIAPLTEERIQYREQAAQKKNWKSLYCIMPGSFSRRIRC